MGMSTCSSTGTSGSCGSIGHRAFCRASTRMGEISGRSLGSLMTASSDRVSGSMPIPRSRLPANSCLGSGPFKFFRAVVNEKSRARFVYRRGFAKRRFAKKQLCTRIGLDDVRGEPVTKLISDLRDGRVLPDDLPFAIFKVYPCTFRVMKLAPGVFSRLYYRFVLSTFFRTRTFWGCWPTNRFGPAPLYPFL